MNKINILIAIVTLSFQTLAQQDAMFTHYAFNTISVNPAYAGNRGCASATALHRSQWVGFDGAPMTQTLALNTPLMQDRLGAGISFQNDKIGPLNTFTADIDLAYKLKINAKNKIAFGVKGGASFFSKNLNALVAHESGDNSISNSTRNEHYFNVGAGLLYTNDLFYIGASVPRFLEDNLENSLGGNLAAKVMQHYYFTAGTAFDINKQITLRPSTFVKASLGAPIQLDLTTMAVFNKKFEVGAMWRSTDALGILVGYTFQDYLRIGYSFDWSYGNETFQTNFGSHELMLRYDLFLKKGTDIISPRYF